MENSKDLILKLIFVFSLIINLYFILTNNLSEFHNGNLKSQNSVLDTQNKFLKKDIMKLENRLHQQQEIMNNVIRSSEILKNEIIDTWRNK